MTKFQKSLSIAFCAVLVFTIFTGSENHEYKKYSMLFPGFILGYSSESYEDKENEKISVLDDETKVEYSFKIFELISHWFD